ncbi:uncharacterized protein C8A04DRAFT_15559 [Dichotomopilus funicola]|uniref:Uncharacterized protein n=1 Tax=Dichotomopilus funicola TaxID=1934379 RepID=A0AAN6UVL3_9PEZI|nr:hypothetical protein C8A04DRAFT_15559 [Dichotomopilus funicola]
MDLRRDGHIHDYEEVYLPIASLNDHSREILTRAITNVLSTDLAKQTYTQIVDGLPLSDVARDTYLPPPYFRHPLFTDHNELCTDLHTIQLLLWYQHTVPERPRALVELVARCVHQIGAWLYRQDRSRHKEDALGKWRPSESDARFYPKTFPETLFCHPWYRDYDQYPGGIADSVGYWAEARILGGVIVFDRRDPIMEDNDGVYTIADRKRTIYRICRFLDGQVEDLVDFLLSETTPSPEQCPLPILPGPNNGQRFDPESPILRTGVWRDPWERRLRPRTEKDLRNTTSVTNEFNYEPHWDMGEAKERCRRERTERGYAYPGPRVILQLDQTFRSAA